MRNPISKIFQKKYPPAWPLCDENTTKPKMNPQRQSPLFDKFSAELRLMVYQAVLVDQHRFLHICRNVTLRKTRRVAHFWCMDMESPFPTWQHTCYGENRHIIPGKQSAFRSRAVTETDDKLLSLLLICRLIYSEALSVLYEGNTFHFRGSTGVLALTSSISTVQWSAIRHVHISTLFQDDSLWDFHDRVWLPEKLQNWNECCQHLCRLPKLDSLTLDLIVIVVYTRGNISQREQRLLEYVLLPLQSVKAKTFEVELNVEPSQEVWISLGEVNFSTLQRERAYNVDVYGTRSRSRLEND